MGYTGRVRRPTKGDVDFEALWARLDEVPEGQVGEIVGGEIVMMPRPASRHLWASSALGGLLVGPFQLGIQGPGGWVILDEPRIRFGDELRVPDLAGWRRERYAVSETGPFTVVPDWICEVLSESTVKDDRGAKMPLYGRAGVSWLWLVDPAGKLLEVYRRERDAWVVVGVVTETRARVPP